jgi:hypothetical protein
MTAQSSVTIVAAAAVIFQTFITPSLSDVAMIRSAQGRAVDPPSLVTPESNGCSGQGGQ